MIKPEGRRQDDNGRISWRDVAKFSAIIVAAGISAYIGADQRISQVASEVKVLASEVRGSNDLLREQIRETRAQGDATAERQRAALSNADRLHSDQGARLNALERSRR